MRRLNTAEYDIIIISVVAFVMVLFVDVSSTAALFPFFTVPILLRVYSLYKNGEITLEKDIQDPTLKPHDWMLLWLGTLLIIGIALEFGPMVNIPDWVKDDDPLLLLSMHVFVQELFFRTYLTNRFRNIGFTWKQNAIATGFLFLISHLILPLSPLVIIGVGVSGFMWSFLYAYKPNLLGVWASHTIMNTVLLFFL